MCGIGGKVSFDKRPDERIAERMIECLPHRGPDAEGIYTSNRAVLAHTRLSILDLSQAGRQPMSNEDEDVHIVFNGEIYNYRELRGRVSDYPFTSETDTEVLLALYEENGIDCLQSLRGMFAFAIWDERKERLFLARDRLGQKPLFYTSTRNSVVFGSTVETILADDSMRAEPDSDALRSYLTYGYVPSPRTGFDSIRQVNPGEYLTFDTDGMERDQYWSLSFSNQYNAGPDELARRVRSKLREATKLRMRSDVPLGVFLSGGLDSSIVVALMSEISDEPVQTYSIGFDVDRFDELEFAEVVAEEFGTEHTEYTVSPDTLLNSVSDLIDHYQVPLGDPSILPTFCVSQLASDHITVALTGDAGDETFAGYNRYRYDRMIAQLQEVPDPIRRLGHGVLDRVPAPFRSHRYVRWPRTALEIADEDPTERYATLICDALDEETRMWAGPPVDDEIKELRHLLSSADGKTRVDQLLQTDIRMNLPDRLLAKVDRASMAHSIEVRSPFLDHEFMELSARVPSYYKLNGSEQKWLLKKGFRDILPDKIISRSKQGFGVPTNEWIRNDLSNLTTDLLGRLGERPLFHQSELLKLLDSHFDGKESNGKLIWNLMILELWYQRYIDPPSTETHRHSVSSTIQKRLDS